VCAVSLAANWLAPVGYAKQFAKLPARRPRMSIGSAPMKWARSLRARALRHAHLAAARSRCRSGLYAIGRAGGRACGILRRNLVASRPRVHRPVSFSAWLFLLITVRAVLPLNVSPLTSVLITFLILGLLGWAAAARVLSTSADALRNSDFCLAGSRFGLHGPRLFLIHVLPNLKPVLYAQFWISIPVFILSEANLGILGLGVAEPLPSWGSLLRELEGLMSFREEPWRLVPLVLLIVHDSSVTCSCRKSI